MTHGLRRDGLSARLVVAILSVAAMAVASVWVSPRASAQEGFEIVIPVETVVRNVGVGSITVLQTRQVPESAQGQFCEVSGESRNQESVHPGNDLIVESGNTRSVLEGVEDVPLGTVEARGQLVLGSTITVALRMGEDNVFSAGIDVIIDCAPEVPLVQSITVVKAASDSTGEFTFDLDGTDVAEAVIDETTTVGFGDTFTWELLPGEYSLIEGDHDDFNLVGAVCDNGDDPSQIDLDARENVTCTFENEPVSPPPPADVLPEISVVKSASVESVPVPGDDVTFNVVISNPSNVEDVRITSIQDDVFGTLAGDADCQVGTVLVPGDSCEFDFVGAVEGQVGGDHVNTVTVEGEDEEGNQVTDEDDATVTFTEVQDLVIIAVTVAGSCEYDDEGTPVGIIDIDLPDGVAQLEISRGEESVATFSESGQATVAVDRSYDWSATAESGFELAESSGSVFVSGEDCPVEVEDEEVLPFTGLDSGALVLAALVLLSSGFVLVRLPRRNGEV